MKGLRLFSNARYAQAPPLGPRGLEAASFFGLKRHQFRRQILPEIDISLTAGELCCIVGPSGTGKTLLLESFYAGCKDRAVIVSPLSPKPDAHTLVDAGRGTAAEVMSCLYHCGLRDAYAMLSSPDWLSGGERFRFMLSRAVASGVDFVFCDEFCSSLDDISAVSVGRYVRSLADTANLSFVLAGWREDILDIIAPDIIIYTGSPEGFIIQRRAE